MNNKALSKNLRNSIIKNILLIISTGIILLVLILLMLNFYTRHNESVSVPEVRGLQLREAQVLLKSRGLEFAVIDSIYERNSLPGGIIDQVPKANSKTKAGREIFLTIYSTQAPELSIPELVDYSYRQAEALLTSMGFEQLSIVETPSEYKGLVKGVEFKGRRLRAEEKIPAGSPLTIIVGSGIQPDSLNIDDGFDSIPSENGSEPPVNRSESNTTTSSKVDESFF